MKKDEYLEIAGELYKDKRYREAIELLDEAQERYPKDAEILMLLAICYIEIIRFIDAVRILLKADKIEPNDPTILYNLGFALLCAGRIKDAYGYFEKCLKLNPEKKIRKMIHRLIKTRGEFEETLDKSECISLEEEFEVYDDFVKAQGYLFSREYGHAISLYKNILERAQNHYPSIQNIGVAYMMQNQPEKAITYFEKSYNLRPTNNLCIANLAHVHYKLGNLEKSESYIKELETKIDKPTLRDLVRILTILIEIKQYNFARKLIVECEYKSSQVVFFSGVLYALEKNYLQAKVRFKMLSPISSIAYKYHEAVCSLEKRKIKEYYFEPKIIRPSIEML